MAMDAVAAVDLPCAVLLIAARAGRAIAFRFHLSGREACIPAPLLGLLRPCRCHGEREPRGERADEPHGIHLIPFLGSMRTTVQATSARPTSGNNTRLTQLSSSAISAMVVERCASAGSCLTAFLVPGGSFSVRLRGMPRFAAEWRVPPTA